MWRKRKRVAGRATAPRSAPGANGGDSNPAILRGGARLEAVNFLLPLRRRRIPAAQVLVLGLERRPRNHRRHRFTTRCPRHPTAPRASEGPLFPASGSPVIDHPPAVPSRGNVTFFAVHQQRGKWAKKFLRGASPRVAPRPPRATPRSSRSAARIRRGACPPPSHER